MATLHVVVGLPGAGKTTLARRLETSLPALRLTPDEWMVPLFGQPETKRDDVEGLLIGIALRSLTLGIDVVVDFGVWSRDERTCLRHLAGDVGASVSTTFGGVPRLWAGPSMHCTAPCGGTRTSTDRPGCRAASSSSVYRTAVARTGRATPDRSGDDRQAWSAS